ncbi:hypothetical protein N7520_000045 [Penicillium odoratum]|uniref:uncharacterized protein n=1 Tax=Penicillium odoratum TaxID=1167516 RepID=UPI0025469B79|nr:uncharacterized protein N7520_000045 [Penicillium odoratum]KAJ5776799.1 hypothetical protein N7520_000045 [Penicillium odoratum]
MHTSFLLATALTILGINAAESSTIIGYFAPGWDATLLQHGGWTSTAASLADINANAATYHVGCEKNAPKTDCDYPTSWTIIQGAETVSFSGEYIATASSDGTSYDITVTQSYECSLKSSTESASCTMSVGMTGSADGAKYTSSSSSAATYTTAPIDGSYYQLTVTAGLSSLTMPAATETGGAVGAAGAMITAAPVVAAAALAALL